MQKSAGRFRLITMTSHSNSLLVNAATASVSDMHGHRTPDDLDP